VARVTARDGIIIEESEERATWTYRARNENPAAVALIVEHRVRQGWTLSPGLKPEESTAGAARFRVPIAAGGEATLEIPEVSRRESRISIGNADALLIARLAQSGVPAQALENALQPVIDKRSELAAIERRLAALQSEYGAIVDDQQRLRENMKALRGSSEEKQLLQRYTRQLDEQESRLDALKQDIGNATAARDTARAELSRLIQAVSFELTAAR
jgi:hypothetical protein